MILMFKTMLIGHFIGDYYLQSDKLSENKSIHNRALFIHAILYSISLLLISTIVYIGVPYIYLLLVCLSHLLIDYLKTKLEKIKKISIINLYLIDQVLHISILFLYCYYTNTLNTIEYRNWVNTLVNNGINIEIYISWILLIAIIITPASITVKTLLNAYQPNKTGSKNHANLVKNGVPNAGAFIGILERILIMLMLTIKQYSSIGLVITAKSVVRYKKISEDPVFSEYYLLGTLLSTIIVIVAYILIIPV